MNIVIFGTKGYLSNSILFDKNKKIKIQLLSKQKLTQKKKIKRKIDLIVHTLGPNKYEVSKNPTQNLIDKIKITQKIIDFAKKNSVKKIIYISSINIYQKNSKKLNFKNAYSKAHIEAETILKKNSSANLKIMILRISHLFGIRDTVSSKGKFLSLGNNFIKHAVEKKIFIVKKPNTSLYILPINYLISKIFKIITFKKNFETKNIFFLKIKIILFLKIISNYIFKNLNYYPVIVYKSRKINFAKDISKIKVYKNKKINFLIDEIEKTIQFFCKNYSRK